MGDVIEELVRLGYTYDAGWMCWKNYAGLIVVGFIDVLRADASKSFRRKLLKRIRRCRYSDCVRCLNIKWEVLFKGLLKGKVGMQSLTKHWAFPQGRIERLNWSR